MFNSGEYNCQKCVRRGCLKKDKFFAIKGVPQSSRYYRRILHWTKAKAWKYAGEIKVAKMPTIGFVNVFFGICPISLVDDAVYGLLDRYFYCKRYTAVAPFPGTYDDQPHEWIWIVNVIEDEIALCQAQKKQK